MNDGKTTREKISLGFAGQRDMHYCVGFLLFPARLGEMLLIVAGVLFWGGGGFVLLIKM